MISYIITTACGDSLVAYQSTPSRLGTIGDRDRLLINYVLPNVLRRQSATEVIVAGRCADSVKKAFPGGEYENPDSRLRYLEVDPVIRWRTESGHIRRVATEEAVGDILVYSCDDHMLSIDFFDRLRAEIDEEWDVWCPARRHYLTGVPLNDGSLDFALADGRPSPYEAYIPWHANVLRRWVAEKVPWDILDPNEDFQDLPMTKAWKEAGARFRWGEPLCVFDVEASLDEE